MTNEDHLQEELAKEITIDEVDESQPCDTSIFMEGTTSELQLGWTQMILLLLGALAVLVGVVVHQTSEASSSWPGMLFILFGLLLFGAGSLALQRGAKTGATPDLLHGVAGWLGVEDSQLLMLLAAPMLALIAWQSAGDGLIMNHPWVAIPAWILAMTLAVAGSWSKGEMGWKKLPRWEAAILLTLFGFAMLMRATRLEAIPWLATGDEGSAAQSAVRFITGEQNNIFSLGWYSFPSLFYFIESLSIRIFGQTVFAIRILSAVAGSLTIVALYWYAKKAFSRWTALFAAVYLAGSHFHNHFSRIALNNIWDGLFMTVISITILIAWKEAERNPDHSRKLFALTGLLFGLSQYFYTSVRILYVIIPAWLFWNWIMDRKSIRSRLPGVAVMVIALLAALLPLALFYFKHPDEFAAPMRRVSILGSWLENEREIQGQSTFRILLKQFQLAATAFTHTNIRMWYEPNTPLLHSIPAAFFLLGVLLTVIRIANPHYAWLLLWLGASIPLAALSESTPAAQRLVIAAPAAATLFALGLVQLGQWTVQAWPKARLWILGVMILVLSLAIGFEIQFYFGDYTLRREFSDLNTEVANVFSDHLQSLDDDTFVYFFGPPRMGFYSHSILQYLNPTIDGEDIVEPIVDVQGLTLHPHTTFIFLPERRQEMQVVQDAFPGGEVVEAQSHTGDPLYILYSLSNP